MGLNMLQILDIYNKLTDESRLNKEQDEVVVLPNEVAPEIGEIKLTKLNQRKYESILFIIDSYKHIRAPKLPSVVKISSNGFLKLYFNDTTIYNYLEEMKRLGIIKLYKSGYFNRHNLPNMDTTAPQYIWFPQNEAKIKEILKEKKVGIRSFKRKMRVKYQRRGDGLLNRGLVRFTSNTQIRKPANFNCYDMHTVICDQLNEVDPLLPVFQKKVEVLNTKYYAGKPEREIKYTPTLKYNGVYDTVTKIGIRYNCEFCTYSKDRKEGFISRDEYLAKEGLDLHYDVRGSVPKISALMNFGEIFDNSSDPYQEIYNEYKKLSGEKDDFSYDTRQCFKYMFVRSYFESSYQMLVHRISSNLYKMGYRTTWNEKKANDDALHDLNAAVIKCCGMPLGSEIFFHESNVYILVLERLLNDGFDVVTCFDSFYAHKDGVNQEKFNTYMDKIIKECEVKYLEMHKEKPSTRFEKWGMYWSYFRKSKKLTPSAATSLMKELGVFNEHGDPTNEYLRYFIYDSIGRLSRKVTNEGQKVLSKLIDDNMDKLVLENGEYKYLSETKKKQIAQKERVRQRQEANQHKGTF